MSEWKRKDERCSDDGIKAHSSPSVVCLFWIDDYDYYDDDYDDEMRQVTWNKTSINVSCMKGASNDITYLNLIIIYWK